MSDIKIGKERTKEHNLKISESCKAVIRSAESKKNISNSKLGKK